MTREWTHRIGAESLPLKKYHPSALTNEILGDMYDSLHFCWRVLLRLAKSSTKKTSWETETLEEHMRAHHGMAGWYRGGACNEMYMDDHGNVSFADDADEHKKLISSTYLIAARLDCWMDVWNIKGNTPPYAEPYLRDPSNIPPEVEQ